MSARNKNLKRHGGFTLIELLVAMFMFVILMAAISQIFTTAFSRYEDASAVQWNLERAQLIMNTLSKELRTSTVATAAGAHQSIQFYDYSQSACLRYRLNNDVLQVARNPDTGSDAVKNCQDNAISNFTDLVNGVNGSFEVVPSDPQSGTPPAGGTVGKVTIALEVRRGALIAVEGDSNPAHRVHIQTSVSLRDYSYVGLLDTDPAP